MNPVVLITGASRGIGAATAKVFASHGYDVVINYKSNYEAAKSVLEEIKCQYSVSVRLVKADVSVESDVISMIDFVKNEFGRLDVLVNNAGIAIDSDFLDKTVESFRKTLDINLVGPFLVCKHAKNIMNKGSIVNVSSTNSIDSYYSYSMEYDASKAGLNLLTKDMAIFFGPDIRVNAVAPGWVDTDMNSLLDDDYIDNEKKKIILDRFADPIEIAKVIYFIASEDASYLNGVVLSVDGGRK